MNETQEQTQTEFVVNFTDESEWCNSLAADYGNYRHAGWQFVTTLEVGISQFSKRRDKATLYAQAQAATGLSYSRLSGLVSMARKPSSRYAAANGLEIAHAEAVQSLDDDHAESMLLMALEENLSAAALGARISAERKAATAKLFIADDGNEHDQRQTNDDELSDNNIHDVPFDNTTSNILYENADDYSAEADAYAGAHAGYEYIDESDNYTYTGEEFAQRMIDAGNRLRHLAELQDGWQRQRTQREWITKLEELIY